MNFILKIIINSVIAANFLFASENVADRLNENDIENSVKRLKTLFFNQTTQKFLEERNGCFLGSDGCCWFNKEKEDEIYITFRGSLGFKEPWQIANTFKIELNCDYGITGKVHKNAYNIFKIYEPVILNCIKSYCDRKSCSDTNIKYLAKDIRFVIEGYSRGTAFATLAAACIQYNFTPKFIKVLNYSPISIFDQEAASDYNRSIGYLNHINFIAEEDFVPLFFTGKNFLGVGANILTYFFKGNFSSVGIDIRFSVEEYIKSQEYTEFSNKLISYDKNVKKNIYPYLDPRLHKIMSWILSAKTWNAHMPDLYQEMSPLYFKEYKNMF